MGLLSKTMLIYMGAESGGVCFIMSLLQNTNQFRTPSISLVNPSTALYSATKNIIVIIIMNENILDSCVE